jgi:hypothetical protein
MSSFKRNEEYVDARRWEGGMEAAMVLSKWMGAGSVYQPPTKDDPREALTVPTPFGPRDIKPGEWVVRSGAGAFLTYKEEVLYQSYSPVIDEEHRLIKHARHELGMLPNEDQDFVESIINAVKGFCTFKGHSGASADIAIHMVTALLRGDNLLPLTDDPEEWEFHPKERYGVERDMWQNKRNSKALSEDGGKTYVMVDEGVNPETNEPILHQSEPKEYTPEVPENDEESPVDVR